MTFHHDRPAAPWPAPAPGWPSPAGTRPGAATAAAVLAFGQAGCYLLLVLAVVVGALADDVGAGGAGLPVLFVLATCSAAALLLLGGVLLLRGGGRTLLLATSWVEAGLLGVVVLTVAVRSATGYPGPAPIGAFGAVALALLAGPVVRLALLIRPGLSAWVAERHAARTGPPVWAPHLGHWVPGAPRPTVSTGAVAAVLLPVGLLTLAATVTLAVTGPSGSLADAGPGSPTDPPVLGDTDYDARFDRNARDCRDGDMTACDDLYYETPIGDPYETFGSTCGGRLDELSTGGCVSTLGPTD